MSKPMVNSSQPYTRKNNLPLLGEGCRNCNVRDKCFMDRCNTVQYTRYQGVSDLTSMYHYYKEDMGFETYVRKYKYGYFLLVKGEKYKSGEIDEGWHFHFYKPDMSDNNHGISNNGHEVEKYGDKYLYIKYLKQHHGINDMIPLKDSNGIILY